MSNPRTFETKHRKVTGNVVSVDDPPQVVAGKKAQIKELRKQINKIKRLTGKPTERVMRMTAAGADAVLRRKK